LKITGLTTHFIAFFCFVCVFLSAPLQAARDSVSFQHLGTEKGLPQSTINVIFQDSQGYMWFGTYGGLSRFDGYQFVTFKNDPNDPNSLSNNIVVSIIEDNLGYLWVATAQNGVNRFNPNTGQFTRFISKNDDFDSLSHAQVQVIHQDKKGRIWIGTNHGLNLYLPEKQAFARFYNNPLDAQSLPPGSIVDIEDDGEGNLWVASNEMLAHFNLEQQVFTYMQQGKSPNQINDIFLDTDNSLWIGTRFDGLFHLKQPSKTFEHFSHKKGDPHSLSFNDVRSILRVRNGDLWIATEEGGINVRRKGDKKFLSFKRNSSDAHSLSINDVWSLYQDRSGLIWIGTAGGGLNTTLSFDSQFSRLTHSPYQKNGLSHEFVWDIEEDSQANIWFATLNGLDRYNPKTDQFAHISQFVDQRNRTVGNRIQSFAFDQKGDLWFGNQQGQIAVYSLKTSSSRTINRRGFPQGYVSYNRIRMVESDRFGFIWVGTDDGLLKINPSQQKIIKDFRFAEDGKLGETTVRTMLQDHQGNIWFGTWNKGLQKYDPEFDRVTSFKNKLGDLHSLSNDTVRSLFMDTEGALWVGTFNGLNLMSANSIASGRDYFTRYLEKDGLPNTAIYGIANDSNGYLWLSTNNGLSRLDPRSQKFKNYSVEDGLPANEFNGNAVARSSDGKIYFGSVNGVSVVSATEQKQVDFHSPLVITSLSILGKKYKAAGVSLNSDSLQLNYNQNNVVFEFASLDFRHVNRNHFRYRLLPDSKQWIEVAKPNQAAFTNLDPKNYTFQLQGTNSQGVWSDQMLSMQLVILPPLWLTWWAFVIYAFLSAALLFYFFYRHKKTLQEQQTINQHLRRVDQLKDEFLANTSHELRTPLNGIIGIAESLKEGSAGLQSAKTLNDLGLIIDGGKRLAQLVNDILDFKKLTHHTLVLQRKAVDIHSVLNVVMSLLKPLAEHKSLSLRNHLPKDLPLVFADEDRLQQIFHNLIGNAIKYTLKGEISVSARLNANEIEICVADSGIGIEAEEVEDIFVPFEQLEITDKVSQKGTGLGLSVTRQLIEQHEGQIWVQSAIDVGSKFYFTLPCWLEIQHGKNKNQLSEDSLLLLENNEIETNQTQTLSSGKQVKATKISDKKTCHGKILIADDDPINLQVLTDLLQMNHYQVSSAKDGIEAADMGLKEKFELAILDIMMPGMSGYQVTKKLRQKYSAIELPILLLSARNQPGDVKAGFEAGANDYVTKPIEREVLLSRIHTMLLLGGLVEAKRQKQHTKTLQQACERLGKYFPKQMVKQIITNDQDNPLLAQRKQITILFADLAGFTSVSDRFEPEAITDILNSFLGKMGELIEQHHGILNEILGDGLVVLFGALDHMNKQQQAQNAANLSLKMQQAMTELAENWLEAGFDHSVQLRIGVHQDFATVGNFGSKEIVAFRAVGSGVNFAARLESYCNAGEITVSYPIYAQCREQFEFSELTEVLLKGFNHKHRVCQLVGFKSL